MNIPLLATASSYGVTIVSRKEILSIPVPFEPYALVHKEGETSDIPSEVLKDFSSGEMVKVYHYNPRVPFEDIPRLQENGWQVQHDKFIEQIMIDKPDFFRKYHNGTPDVLCFDIEVLTDGTGIFPHADRCPIISISAEYQDEPPVIFMNYGKGKYPDRQIIQDFLMYFKDKNPDIVVTYNGASFDLPYFCKRALMCGIQPELYSRIKREWHFKGSYNIPGHLHYDIYRVDVFKDQSLFGIRNRKMKTVANWFKIPALELSKDEISNTQKLIGTQKLRKYNESDVKVTRALYNIYHLNHVMMAELLGVPLENAVNAYPSFAPKIVLARSLKKLGFVFLDSNEARYPTITGRYEGAVVGIYKKGFIPKVWHLDISGFYPSTMMVFNISPETTKIEGIEPYSGNWNHALKDNRFWLRIPDKKLQKDIVISIDQKERGVLSTLLEEMKNERTKLKKNIKKAKTEDVKSAAKAQSTALKVLMNAIYGSAALPETVYSDLGVALATISICRFIFQKIIERYQPDIIEADSVLGNTPVWFRENGGAPDIRTIEELYAFNMKRTCGNCQHFNLINQKCKKASTPTENAALCCTETKCFWANSLEWEPEDGRTMPQGLEVLGCAGWSKVEHVYRHTVEKPCYRVHTETGLVDVTEDHSLFMGGIDITPTTLKRGDVLDTVTIDIKGKDVISSAYARALGFICSTSYMIGDTIETTVVIPKEIVITILSAHPDSSVKTRMVRETVKPNDKNAKLIVDGSVIKGPFTERIRRICFSGDASKVPRAILEGSAEIAKAFILGYRLAGKGLTTRHSVMAAGLAHLVRKTGKSPAVSCKTDGGTGETYIISQKAKDPGSRVTKIEKITTWSGKKVVYDISTAEGTFSSAQGSILLHNTDGVYVDKPLDEKEMETFVATIVKDLIGSTKRRIEIERNAYGPGWFHLAKNYVLLDLDTGDPIFHGVAFKSTSHCAIYGKVLHKIASMILDGESVDFIWTSVKPMLDTSTYTLDDFLMRTTVRQDPSAYANENAMQVRLAVQAEEQGIDVVPGTTIEYIVTRGRQYTLASRVTSVEEVDHGYYQKEISKALSLFNLRSINQLDFNL